MSKPDWDLLIVADEADEAAHDWFPADKVKDCKNLIALEGIRFRHAYLTSKAIEQGSAALFDILYRYAKISLRTSSVLHISDYREYE